MADVDVTRMIAAVVAFVASQVIAVGLYIALTAGKSGLLTAVVLWSVALAVGLPAVGIALGDSPRRSRLHD